MPTCSLKLFSPHDVYDRVDGQILTWDSYPIKFLAQGDSWFSIGAMPPWATSNLLQKISLGVSASAINCAFPGRELSMMLDWKKDQGFSKLLAGNLAVKWNGILLSAGGNDLIAAVQQAPTDKQGNAVPPSRRLLLKAGEWGPSSDGVRRYISSDGWKAFSGDLASHLTDVINLRDSGINKGVPLFLHTYDYPMPRNAPASTLFEVGPWLYTALKLYNIPEADWFALSKELIDRMAVDLQGHVADLCKQYGNNIFLIDTRGTIEPAGVGSTGVNADWENEIHPTAQGYKKLAKLWRSRIDAVIPAPAPTDAVTA